MRYILYFGIIISLVGCTSALQAPDVYERKKSVEVNLSGSVYDNYCKTVSGHQCQSRYYNVALKEEELKNSIESYGLDRFQRNRVQTLLMAYSDQMCANYHYRIYGVELGTRVGENIIGDLIGGLAAIFPGREIGRFAANVSGAFERPGSILSDEFVQQSLFLSKIQGVSSTRREMKKYMMAAHKHPVDYPAIAEEQVREVYEGKVGSKYYTAEEAVSDALAYHRMCDMGAMLIGGTLTQDAHKDLFAYRFSDEWQKGT